eukprot:gnl/MRDRNA2_/MRDRNA2_23642_c0_seq1.p1 gnl/MRDRNA2_/MRDRNA2_23642_c0~~gnl/MRDRNA2_/MRDRNA2_23642_c0_seq1.p1  ORF type:complete len:120 (-),score=12.01 gnl/MRDRNA2_/MRDRNA2_23642_c0_seq1:62-421(-)
MPPSYQESSEHDFESYFLTSGTPECLRQAYKANLIIPGTTLLIEDWQPAAPADGDKQSYAEFVVSLFEHRKNPIIAMRNNALNLWTKCTILITTNHNVHEWLGQVSLDLVRAMRRRMLF